MHSLFYILIFQNALLARMVPTVQKNVTVSTELHVPRPQVNANVWQVSLVINVKNVSKKMPLATLLNLIVHNL